MSGCCSRVSKEGNKLSTNGLLWWYRHLTRMIPVRLLGEVFWPCANTKGPGAEPGLAGMSLEEGRGRGFFI